MWVEVAFSDNLPQYKKWNNLFVEQIIQYIESKLYFQVSNIV